jgi:hypothetical protein
MVTNMDTLDEAKEIMQAAGCIKAFPIYDISLTDITEIKSCHENGESIELEKDISKLVPTFSQEMRINAEKPIACPIDTSLSKYLEFSLKNKQITPCNINTSEFERIKINIHPLLEKYNWIITK